MRRLAVVGVIAAISLTGGCKTNPMEKIDGVRAALEKDEDAAVTSAVSSYAPCADAPPVALLPTQPSPRDAGCFGEIATALGSKRGFNGAPPDQAAAATAAIVLLRDSRGDWIAHSENWLASIKAGKGAGIDTLRLAVARKMAESAPKVGRRIEEEKDALEAMKAVAQAIPGACPTYWLLGSGTNPSTITAENSADHAACVHRDLGRREGPGASYGSGTFRALEGSLALWRETERALRLGLSVMGSGAKMVVEKKLTAIEAATQAIATKKMASTTSAAVVEALGEAHADAGVVLWRDAGADAGPAPLRKK